MAQDASNSGRPVLGAFARVNIQSPGIRLQFKPRSNVSGFIAHRAHWLAQKRDAWANTKLRDTTGQSGSYIGQLLEARLRWEAVPKLVKLETGWAHLFKGDFAKNAPGAPEDKEDADYFYAQSTLTF
ncbi:alginate export family protein [Methylomarinum vadi]|uniref:alginate export family protein n=1 Tax=Methylomarinum vadi TaxID=438855 RepID=UPI002285D536|nr:alginate export family protein [Methylomarinum vadi]